MFSTKTMILPLLVLEIIIYCLYSLAINQQALLFGLFLFQLQTNKRYKLSGLGPVKLAYSIQMTQM